VPEAFAIRTAITSEVVNPPIAAPDEHDELPLGIVHESAVTFVPLTTRVSVTPPPLTAEPTCARKPLSPPPIGSGDAASPTVA
jgi:hypothetical protein